jgi:hypothetical protein
MTAAARTAVLEGVCGGALGGAALPVCPDDLATLGSATGWVWLDVTFSGAMSPLQAGLAWADPARPTFDGPSFDPNTGKNASLDVFETSSGYAVGATRFDGSFSSGPSDDVVAILRPDGVTMILSADALTDCTEPTVFVVGPGGIDTADLPDPPASTVIIGAVAPTTTTTTSTTTTTLASSAPESTPAPTTTTAAPASAATTLPASEGDASGPGTSPLWPILIGLGLLLVATGIALLIRREPPAPVAISVAFEKGNDAPTAAVMPA